MVSILNPDTAVAGLHLVENESHDVLVPQPSNNPDDPLNWNPFWKGITMTSMIMTAFIQAFGPLAIAPQVPAYMKEWDRGLADILRFVTFPCQGSCEVFFGRLIFATRLVPAFSSSDFPTLYGCQCPPPSAGDGS
jgi:hypothetical protein